MPERELSPYSARVALTQKLQQGPSNPGPPAEHNRRPWDSPRNGPHERAQHGQPRSPAARGGRWDTRASPPPVDRGRDLTRGGDKGQGRLSPQRSVRDGISEERAPDVKSKELSEGPARSTRDRDASPEPYRKPRASSRERKRDRSRGDNRARHRDRSEDRRRTTEPDRIGGGDRSKHRERSKTRNRSRDRYRERRHDRSRERKREDPRERQSSRDRDRRRHRSRSTDRHRHRNREHDRDHERSRDRRDDRALKRRSASTSPPPKRRRRRSNSRSRSRSPAPHRRSAKPLPDQEVSFRGADNSDLPPTKYGGAPPNLEKPNFKPTGLLAKAANKVEGTKISLKYHEPPEARKPPPSQPWRITVFKGDDVVDTIELATKSCWLFGRSVEVVDYPLEHPSSSGQHAVIQFRYTQKTVEDEYGVKKVRGKVKPYIIDLESSNGTELNDERIETSRYFELRDKDILKFAGSEREYIVQLPPKD